ncbi:MAG: hypothetical protein KGL42_01390 [Betaproteobacteria bacterium]|nr:hypothetical protein [Betaproteobacteria bacterium]
MMISDITTHRAFGAVLDPVQFAAELASLKQRPQYQGRALSVTLPDAVTRLFESPLVPKGQGVAISDGAALPVAVVTVQAGGTQLTCLVPLATSEARDWFIESVERQRRMFIAVNVPERRQLVLVQSDAPVRDVSSPAWTALRDHLRGYVPGGDQAAEVLDMVDVLRLAEESTQSFVPGFEVSERWVFVCVPYQTDGHAVQAPVGAGKGAGAVALH